MPNPFKKIRDRRSESRRRKDADDSDSQDAVEASAATASVAGLPTRKGLGDYFPNNQTLGLRVLHDLENARVDIVFIHGLMGNAYKTWLHETGVYWPVEILAKEMPDARIISFGYDSAVLGSFSSLGQNNLRGHATSLLGQLENVRTDSDKASNRAIILVVHSLGGLVAKKALNVSAQSPHAHLRYLHQHIRAVLFLGTPHRGSDLAPNARRLAKFLKQVGGSAVNPNILEPLMRKSEILEEVESEFDDWLTSKRDANETFTLTCFYEELECPGLGFNMAKFGASDDPGFQSVHGELRRWARNITQPSMSQHSASDVNAMLRSLAFYDMNIRKQEVEKALPGTCAWVFHSRSFTFFRNNGGLLWIKGKPGSGKSTLMREIVQVFTETDHVVASFFLHGRGSTMQQSLLGLFRSILHQLSTSIPELASKMTTTYLDRMSKMGPAPDKWDWALSELKDIFVGHLRGSPLRKRIWIFLDALDEAGEPAALELVHLLQDLLPTEAHSNTTIHNLGICFSSRHYPILCENIGLEICLEYGNHKDIAAVSRQLLMYSMNLTPAELQELCVFIERRADGIFLWARLVLDQIVGLSRSHPFGQIRKRVEKIPVRLEDFYREKLREMNDEENSQGLRILQWISFGAKAMTLAELRIALLLDNNRPETTLSECLEAVDYAEDDTLLKRIILDRTRGLTQPIKTDGFQTGLKRRHETEGGRWAVQLIHQSVKDFLQRAPDEMNVGSVRSNYLLFRSCMKFMSFPEYKHIIKKLLGDGQEDLQIGSIDLPTVSNFTAYATKNWYLHAKVAEGHPEFQNDIIQSLSQSSGNDILDHWWRLYDKLQSRFDFLNIETRKYSEHNGLRSLVLTPDIFAARFSPTLLHILLRVDRNKAAYRPRYYIRLSVFEIILHNDRVDMNSRDDRGYTPLHEAVSNFRSEVLQLLLDQSDIDINPRDNRGWTPSDHALCLGRPEALKSLFLANQKRLEAGADISFTTWNKERCYDQFVEVVNGFSQSSNRTEVGWTTLLHVAAHIDEDDLCRFLLASGFDPNVKDEWGREPIHRAAALGHTDMVSLLFDSGSDLNTRDAFGHKAVINRHFEVARLCARAAGVFGDSSMIPLLDAVLESRKKEAYTICMSETDFSLSPRGTKLMDLAAIDGDLPMMQALVNWPGHEIGANSKAQALCEAVHQGVSKVAKLFLDKGANANTRDKLGRPMLWIAAERGDLQLVKLLVGYGAYIELACPDFLTPLHKAAQSGHLEVVKQLVEMGAKLSAQTSDGKRALDFATDPETRAWLQMTEHTRLNEAGKKPSNE